MKKETIICFVGASGAGKTSLASVVGQVLNIPVVCSYTTRPMREGEVDGVDHHFITEDEMTTLIDQDELFAYTYFGGNHYGTTKRQVEKTCIYVIDEFGVNNINKDRDLMVVYIDAEEHVRKLRGISQERIDRDKNRIALERPINVSFDNSSNSLFRSGLALATLIEHKLKNNGI